MAEALAAIGLAASIVQFIDLTTKLIRRLDELDEASSNFQKSLRDVRAQLPLLVAITDEIHRDCRRRLEAGNAQAASRRDQQLIGALEGLRRQVENLDECVGSWKLARQSTWMTKVRKVSGSFTRDKEIAAIEKRIETYKSLLTLNFSIPISDASTPRTQEISSFNVLPRDVSRFVGRKSILNEIARYHQSGRSSNSGRNIVMLQGMGGQGKTQTALQYCREFLNTHPASKVVWLDAFSPQSVLRSFETVYGLMNPSDNTTIDQKSKRTAVLREIDGWKGQWCLVFDNYDTPSLFGNLFENFPTSLSGNYLFTTRNAQAASRLGHRVELSGMSVEEGTDLLFYRSEHPRTAENIIEASTIVERLGCLPLAIDQAAAYMKARKLPLKDFWVHFNKRRQHILSHTPSADWEYRKSLTDGSNQQSLSAFTTWELSLSEFNADESQRRCIDNFLTFASFFDSSTVSETLFEFMTTDRGTSSEQVPPIPGPPWLLIFQTHGVWDSFAFQDVVAQCFDLSLVLSFDIDGPHTSFRLHPLIADWLKLRKSHDLQWIYLSNTAATLQRYIDGHQDTRRSLPNRFPFGLSRSREIVSYIDDCLHQEIALREVLPSHHFEVGTLQSFASMMWALDRWHEARDILARALDLAKLQHGPSGTATLSVMHDLGDLQGHLDELDKAEELLTYVVEHRGTELDSNNLSLLQAEGALGVIRRRRGDLEPALKSLRRCVMAAEATDIEPHLSIDWYSNLGFVLSKTSSLDEAEAMLKRVVEQCQEGDLRLSLEHLWPLYWLARLFCSLDRFEEAEALLRAEYRAVLERYGPSGWETLLMDLLEGTILLQKGSVDQGKTKLQACRESFFLLYNTSDVEEILETNYLLGKAELEQGNLQEARRLLSQSANGWEKMCGVGTSNAIDNLSALLEVYIAIDEVEALQQTVDRLSLTIEGALDKRAPAAQTALRQLSKAYRHLGQDSRADACTGAAEVSSVSDMTNHLAGVGLTSSA